MGTRAACALWVLSLAGCSLDLAIPDRGVASDAPGQLDGPGQREDGPDSFVSPVIISTSGMCPTDHPVLLGGGGKCSGTLSATAASGDDKWTVICIPSEIALRFALCGTPDLLGKLSTVSCAGESTVKASCSCPTKYYFVSIAPAPGGWKFTCTDYFSRFTGPELATGGKCLTTGTQPAQKDGTQTASAQCPGGYFVVSGGCEHLQTAGVIRASYPSSPSSWTCESSLSSAKVRAHAVCWKP